jgi:hypothetical protein
MLTIGGFNLDRFLSAGRVIQNDGTALWNATGAGGIRCSNGSIVNNGMFTATTGMAMTGDSGTNLFENNGDFVKTGSGTVRFYSRGGSMPFTNLASVDVQGERRGGAEGEAVGKEVAAAGKDQDQQDR